MTKKYDTLVYIGRFQPLMINTCLSDTKHETFQANISLC